MKCSKKMLSLILAAVMAATLFAGCGTPNAPADTSTPADSTQSDNANDTQATALDTDICVITREDGSGTRSAFTELMGIMVDDVDHTTPSAEVSNSTSVVIQTVAGNDSAIGYISLGSLSDDVKAVKVDGVEASVEDIKNGTYAVSRPFNIAVKGELSDIAADFVSFLMSADGQAVISEEGYISVDEAAGSYTPANLSGTVTLAGRDINVIEKQLPTRVGWGSTLFEIVLWCLFIVPGLIFLFMKIGAKNYFQQLQQKIQADASTIDNYLEQRVQILKNLAKLVEKAIDLDKDVMKAVAAFRGGRLTDGERNAVANQIDGCFGRLFPQVEAYPDLKAHAAIAEAIQQNSYLQKEITAARQLYNDSVMQWNADIFDWPTKQIVAARAGYTTRIPFTASAEIKSQARGTFF